MKKLFIQLLVFICLTASFQFATAQVSIDSIVPSQACLGDFISIYGSGLNTVTSVTVGGQAAPINGTTTGQLIATIPTSLTLGGSLPVVVTNGGNTASGAVNVDYLDPSFSYANMTICTGTGSFLPDTIANAGVFSSDSNLTLNGATGNINLTTSSPGTYQVSHSVTSSAGCSYTATQNITLNNGFQPVTFFLKKKFCKGSPPDKPIILHGDSTGFFTYNFLGGIGPPAISWISPSTGLINFNNSGIGVFEIVYTVPGPCPRVGRDTIEIFGNDTANFFYDTTAYCQGNPNPIPTILSDSQGVFTEATGSVVFVNATSGEINLDSSLVGGPYLITFSPLTYCPIPLTFALTIYPDSSYCLASSINENLQEKPLTLFPNPTNDKFRVELPTDMKTPGLLKVMSLQGKVLFAEKINPSLEVEIDVSGLASGMYAVVFENKSLRSFCKLKVQRN